MVGGYRHPPGWVRAQSVVYVGILAASVRRVLAREKLEAAWTAYAAAIAPHTKKPHEGFKKWAGQWQKQLAPQDQPRKGTAEDFFKKFGGGL